MGNVPQERVPPVLSGDRLPLKQAPSILDVLGYKSGSFKQCYVAHPYLCFIPAKLMMVCLGMCGIWDFLGELTFVSFFSDDKLNEQITQVT